MFILLRTTYYVTGYHSIFISTSYLVLYIQVQIAVSSTVNSTAFPQKMKVWLPHPVPSWRTNGTMVSFSRRSWLCIKWECHIYFKCFLWWSAGSLSLLNEDWYYLSNQSPSHKKQSSLQKQFCWVLFRVIRVRVEIITRNTHINCVGNMQGFWISGVHNNHYDLREVILKYSSIWGFDKVLTLNPCT